MPIEVWIALAFIVLCLGLATRRGWGKPSARRTNADYQNLLTICLNDRRQAARLIAGEKRRTPGISDQQACRRAIARIRRDNR